MITLSELPLRIIPMGVFRARRPQRIRRHRRRRDLEDACRAVRLGETLEPRGEIRRLPDHGRLLGRFSANQVTDDHETRRDADPDRRTLAEFSLKDTSATTTFLTKLKSYL